MIQAFYTMLEMASVSFNKVRLQYYVSKGNKRAVWLNFLIHNPARLFGTTLLGVNIALQIGSECSRQFYYSLDLSPDLAPLTQVFFVLIFAELAPMFAARLYAEHVVMLGIPIIYASSRLMKPIILAINLIARLVNKIVGSKQDKPSTIFLTREELQKIFEERDEPKTFSEENDEFNNVVANIFSFRGKVVEQVMTPSHEVLMLPSNSTIGHLRKILSNRYSFHIPIYQRSRRNIIGVVSPRKLLGAPSSDRILKYSQPPWFLPQQTQILSVLEQFRQNHQNIAVVLDRNGIARGILTLEDILNEIFGEISEIKIKSEEEIRLRVIERTFPGNMEIQDFNEQFNADISHAPTETLAELLNKHFDHHPEKGESIRIDHFELTVEEASLLGAKTIKVRSIID